MIYNCISLLRRSLCTRLKQIFKVGRIVEKSASQKDEVKIKATKVAHMKNIFPKGLFIKSE